jgi:alpha-tubulin suppressor-like RCC1 family protein
MTQQKIRKVVAGKFSAAINEKNQILIWGKGEFGLIKSP